MDFKYKDLQTMEDKSIDVTLYNGGIVNTENRELAELLRQKSKVMIAFGSCACFGGIPGLGNTTTRDTIFQVAYEDTPSTFNPDFVTPQVKTSPNGRKLTLPKKYNTAKALDQVVEVNYYLPGCPPAVELIEQAVEILATFADSGELPPFGTTIASEKSVCEECELEKEDKMINDIRRPYEFVPDPDRCLLEQGLLCMGPATRGGCGTRCINALMPCRGCMGPLPNVQDQGTKMISALAGVLGAQEETEMEEEAMSSVISRIKDPLGTFYRFSLPTGLVNRTYENYENDEGED